MGLGQNLKDFYYSLEDGYYKVLDKIDKVVPVYKIIDPIDEVVPSFLLFILLVAFALAGAFLFLQGGVTPPSLGPEALLSMTVTDAKGNSLQDAQVFLTAGPEEYTLVTNDKGQLAIELVKGVQVQLIVTKDGYEGVSKSFLFDDDTRELKLSLQEKEAAGPLQPQPRTISIVDKSGRQLDGRECKVRLSCSTLGARFLQDSYTVTTGSLSYLPPDNCGTVIVNADCPGSDAYNGIDDGSGLIQLQQAEVKEGGVLIRLSPTLDGARIQLRNVAGAVEDEGYSSYGEKTFKVAPGTYYVVVTDVTGDYAMAQSEKFIVYAEQTKTVDVTLTREVQAVILVKVLDKVSGSPVTGAKVTLKRENGEAIGTQSLEPGKTQVSFSLDEKGKFFVEAYDDNYLSSADVAVDATNASKTQPLNVEVRLEKLTAENSGQVEVTVLDEESLPVPNAKVALYYSQTKFLCEACGTPSSDDKGIAKFKGLKGKYYAFAQKFPATGKSPDQDLLVKQVTKFTVNMKIGFGTIKVNARDADGQGVPFVDVEIFNAAGTKLGTISGDDKGVATYQAKADKAVYVRVSKQFRTSWTSRLEQVYPDQTIEFNALLVERIVGKEPKVVFEGLFDKANTKANSLAPGERYRARFSIQVPSESTLKALRFFIRTGTENDVLKDPWFVNNANVPTATVLKGTTWNPPIGNDEALLTNGDAKWAKVSWAKDSGIEPGIYNVDVELKVRPETQLGSQLALSYRIQSQEIQGKFLRDPVDTVIGDKQDAPAKKELYANTYDKSFTAGQAEACANGFCYGERLFDTVDNVYLKPPFQVRVFQKYRFESSITNDSPTVHDNANLRIKITQDGIKTDDSLVINKYTVINADSTQFSETGQKYELPPLALGKFTQNKTLKGDFDLEARKEGQTGFQQLIVSSGNQAFNHLTQFGIFSEQRLKIDVDQDVIPAYLETRLKVHITFAGGDNSGFDVDQALVRVRRKTPDLAETVSIKYTDAKGLAEFIVPASLPGTKITIEVEKRGYITEALVIQISDKPVELAPATLTYSLGLTTNTERDAQLTITNKIPQKLYIKTLTVRGDKFRGLLDQQKMQNYLGQYTLQPFWLEENNARSINVKAAVSALARLLKEKTSVEGSLYIELTNEARTATFIYSVPIKVDIGLSEPPKVKNCLVIQPDNWEDTTFESKLVRDITVKNNCITKDGQPMDLSNLTAMIAWSGDIVGYVEITLNDTLSGATPTELLQTNRPTKLFETVPADKEYVGTLTFTPLPDPSVLGKTAKFSVILDAEVLSDSGPQSVGASKLDGELLITNLDQCVKFTPDSQNGVRVKRGDADGQEKFQIDTKACGNIDIDFRFCDNDDCRGGTAEGGIQLDPWEISNAKPDETYDVLVNREQMPGYYGVPVHARPAGGGWRQIAEYKVVIESEGFLDLDKYRFFTPPGESDSATLKNFKLQEDVDVKADMCAWGEASKDSDFAGAGAGAVAMGAVMVAAAGGLFGGATGVIAAFASSLSLGPIGIALVVIGIILLLILGGDDCHDDDDTQTLKDYVINLSGTTNKDYARYLPPDAQNIIMDKEKLTAFFNLLVADPNANNQGIQTVGVIFQNSDLQEDQPTYAVATVSATVHHHGDPTHTQKGSVECDNGGFGYYWIGGSPGQGSCTPAYNETQNFKFHLRFQTGVENLEIPAIDFDTFACSAGVQLGVNGPGALPRTRLNWNWNGTGSIDKDSCNTGNPSGIYCDAVQFNIALNKRLKILEEFLRANNYEFTCPTGNEEQRQITQFNTENSNHAVEAGKVGLSNIVGTLGGDDITIQVTATNNGSAPADAAVNVAVIGTGGQQKTCSIAVSGISNIASVNTKNGQCLVNDLADGIYTATAEIASASSGTVDNAISAVAV